MKEVKEILKGLTNSSNYNNCIWFIKKYVDKYRIIKSSNTRYYYNKYEVYAAVKSFNYDDIIYFQISIKELERRNEI